MKLSVFDSGDRQIIRVNKAGQITISAAFVHGNKLEGKHVILCKDDDDKDRKFLYLTYNLNSQGALIKKSKNGIYSFTNKQIAEYFVNKSKSLKFSFLRRISEKNEPYFLFEKKEEK